jgi:hypothetical protein
MEITKNENPLAIGYGFSIEFLIHSLAYGFLSLAFFMEITNILTKVLRLLVWFGFYPAKTFFVVEIFFRVQYVRIVFFSLFAKTKNNSLIKQNKI